MISDDILCTSVINNCSPAAFYCLLIAFLFTDLCGGHLLWARVEGPQAEAAVQHDQGVPTPPHRVAQQDLETGLLLQERQAGHLPDHDHPKPLRLALQHQENLLHGEVSRNWKKGCTHRKPDQVQMWSAVGTMVLFDVN